MNAVTLYNDIWSSTSELEERCKESLNPRGSDMLYEHFASFSPTVQSEVIDIGCRDATYAIELAKRFGCRVLGIDPAPIHIERARKNIAEAGLAERVRAELAGIEGLPAAAGSLDLIWCRDVLNHVDLQRGLAECARVLKPGGHMLVYQTFATEALEAREARSGVEQADQARPAPGEVAGEEQRVVLADDAFGRVRTVDPASGVSAGPRRAALRFWKICWRWRVCGGARQRWSNAMGASTTRRPMPAACGGSTRCLANSSRLSICWRRARGVHLRSDPWPWIPDSAPLR